MDITAEFLVSCVVAGDKVSAGTIRPLRADIFRDLKIMGHVREHIPGPAQASEPVKVEAPAAESSKPEPATANTFKKGKAK